MANEEVRIRNIDTVRRVTIECFMKYGIEPTTMGMIAAHAGVTVRSVQRYFHSKDNLAMVAAIELLRVPYRYLETYTVTPEYKNLSGREQIFAVMRKRAEFASAHYETIVCISELEIYLCKRSRLQDLYNRCRTEFGFIRTMISSALEKGIADGTIHPEVDRTELIDTFTLGFKGLMQRIALIRTSGETITQDNILARHVNSSLRVAQVMLSLGTRDRYEFKI